MRTHSNKNSSLDHINSLVGEQKKVAIAFYVERNKKKKPLHVLATELGVTTTYLGVITSYYQQNRRKQEKLEKERQEALLLEQAKANHKTKLKSSDETAPGEKITPQESRRRKSVKTLNGLTKQGVFHLATLATFTESSVVLVRAYLKEFHPEKVNFASQAYITQAEKALKFIEDGCVSNNTVVWNTGLHPVCIEFIRKYKDPKFFLRFMNEIIRLYDTGIPAKHIGRTYGLPGTLLNDYRVREIQRRKYGGH